MAEGDKFTKQEWNEEYVIPHNSLVDECEAGTKVEEAGEHHRWSSNDDVTAMKDSLIEICPDNADLFDAEFDERITKRRWSDLVLTRLKEAIDRGCCEEDNCWLGNANARVILKTTFTTYDDSENGQICAVMALNWPPGGAPPEFHENCDPYLVEHTTFRTQLVCIEELQFPFDGTEEEAMSAAELIVLQAVEEFANSTKSDQESIFSIDNIEINISPSEEEACPLNNEATDCN
jgi:hypothetical protein